MYYSYMTTRRNVVLSVAAGIFSGGVFYYSSMPANAQSSIPVITITKEGRLFLNDNPVNINLLPSEIKHRFPAASEVYVRPDKQTPWNPVSQVLSVLEAAKPPIPVRFVELGKQVSPLPK